MFVHVFYKNVSASLHNLMDDEGKFTTMSKSLVDVPPKVFDILYFDGSNQESKQAYEVCLKGTSKLEDQTNVFLFT